MHNILVVLPISHDRHVLRAYEHAYRFHWMDDPKFTYRQPNPYTPDPEFDLVQYTERCSAYISEHQIDGVLYSHDLASMVAGILCQRHGLPGPTFEATFLASHKYYSRCREHATIWFDHIDLASGRWGSGVPRFPCYLKPTNLMSSMLQFRINSQEELDAALLKIRPELRSWNSLFTRFFSEYVDLETYPLAAQNILLAEEFVENGSEYIVEGWSDASGTAHIWSMTDTVYFLDAPQTVDAYISPSRLSPEDRNRLREFSLQVVEAHGLRNGFWNVEVWIRDGELILTELNGRAASVWEPFHNGLYGKSIYRAMLSLCTGDLAACLEETPRTDSPRVGGQFHLTTFAEGRAEEFFDFPRARALDTGQMVFCSEEHTITRQLRTRGFRLAMFYLFAPSMRELTDAALDLRARLTKRPEQSPSKSRLEPRPSAAERVHP